jgi:hypothetical protein
MQAKQVQLVAAHQLPALHKRVDGAKLPVDDDAKGERQIRGDGDAQYDQRQRAEQHSSVCHPADPEPNPPCPPGGAPHPPWLLIGASSRTPVRTTVPRVKACSPPSYAKPELMATGPNQLWSWDRTKLNEDHHHSSLAMLAPVDLHHKLVDKRIGQRQAALDAAFPAPPERFPRGRPTARRPAREVRINKPSGAPGAAVAGETKTARSRDASGVTGPPPTVRTVSRSDVPMSHFR